MVNQSASLDLVFMALADAASKLDRKQTNNARSADFVAGKINRIT
jgi:hypothetical protein